MADWNADEFLIELRHKIDENEKITKEELIRLVLMPLMGGESAQKERITGAFRIIEKAKEIYIMQEVKMVFETENIFIPKEALAFLMNDDINAIKELTEIILDAESVEFYCENMEMAIEEIQMKMES